MTAAAFRTLPFGSQLFRVHAVGQSPLWFGPAPGRPPRHRFESPDGRYRVCYLAHTPAGAFVETFLRNPEIAGPGVRILAASELRKREITRVHVRRPLTVARQRGPGLVWRGITASISSSPLYDESQKLATVIHSEQTRPAGIEYRCRHDDDELAVAIFDRNRRALRGDPSFAFSCLDLAIALQHDYPLAVDLDA